MGSNLQKLKQKAFKNPEVQREFDILSDEFEMINQLLNMRSAADLTQKELADCMGARTTSTTKGN